MITSISNLSGNTFEFVQIMLLILFLLVFFTILFFIAYKVKKTESIYSILVRIKSWWIIFFLCLVFLGISKVITTIGLCFLSFIAFRELVSLLNFSPNPKMRRSLFWAYMAIPIQFYLTYKGDYYLFSIFIPVFMFLFLPFRTILSGVYENVTSSNARTHWVLMLTGFNLSHLAFIMTLPEKSNFSSGNACMVIYLLFLTQFNDVQQFLWGKAFGKRKIAPVISPNKTIAGFVGGFIGTIVLAYLLRYLTPLTEIQSAIMGAVIAFSGFIGDLNISSIKRDIGVKDTGAFIPGHGGIMDRLDSLCFTAPTFVHLLYYWHYL